MCQEITNEIQEVIDYVLENEQDVTFKVCKECGRNLPCHDWFYGKSKRKEKFWFNNKCKECESKTHDKGLYRFKTAMNRYWYTYKTNEIKSLARIMSDEQLAKYFDRSISNIEHILYNVLKINSKTRIIDLNKKEIIQIYEYTLSGDRESFPKYFFNEEYSITLLTYVFNEKLKWDIKYILENLNLDTLDIYRLYGLRKNRKFIDIVNMINKIYNTDYKIWQFKKSNVSDYFKNKDNINNAIIWFKEKIKDKNINNIYDAFSFGFVELVREYDLYGFVQRRFSNYYDFYEIIFNEKFDIETYKKNNYPFNICSIPISLNKKGLIYELTSEYDSLDDIGKTLINEMIKFCELNDKFPILQDLLQKDGYISYAYLQKYFNNMETIYKYIYPLDIRPNTMKCNTCENEFPFTEEFFVISKKDRYGLLYQCKKCSSNYSMRATYKKYGISLLDNVTEIDPTQWWEYLYTGIIPKMPDFCFEKENIILIIRYVFFEKLKLRTKRDLLNTDKYSVGMNGHLKLNGLYNKFNSKKEIFFTCFPEFNFTEDDFNLYNDDNVNYIIDNWIRKNNFTIIDLLKKGITVKFDKDIENMYVTRFSSATDMFLWYFDYNNITHPKFKRKITVFDFQQKPDGFWDNKNNRVIAIKNYCENKCKVSIIKVKDNTEKLRKWVLKNFNQDKITKILTYNKYVDTLYDLLIESYPEIKENKILFGWEWHQTKNGTFSRKYLIKCLRELVLYRMNHLIINIKEDLPKYLNNIYISMIYPKLNQHKNNNFESYYEWACLSFPEYAEDWNPEDFGSTYAFDGAKCDSIQEKIVYEYIKRNMGLEYIISTGRKHKGDHIIEVDKKIYGFKKCCPDFIIEQVKLSGELIKLSKPIYIEYYGLYIENNTDKIFVNYVKKTHLKNKIYSSLDNIIFVDLYPGDLKNNCDGIKNKINNVLNELEYCV